MVEKKYKYLNKMLIDLEKSVHYKISPLNSWYREKKERISKKDIILLKNIKIEIKNLSDSRLLDINRNNFPNIFALKAKYIYVVVILYVFGLLMWHKISIVGSKFLWTLFMIHVTHLLRKWQTNAYIELGNFIHAMRLEIDTDYYEKSDEYLQKINAEKNR